MVRCLPFSRRRGSLGGMRWRTISGEDLSKVIASIDGAQYLKFPVQSFMKEEASYVFSKVGIFRFLQGESDSASLSPSN